MGKPNKNKKAHNEPNSKIKIEEVEFKVESNDAILSPGEKKFLAQQERIRKEEEEERLKKENLEAEKKKKNNKTPNKTKTKQSPPKTKEESKSNSKPKNKEDYKPEVKPMNKEIENKPEVKPKATPNKNDANNSSFQETSKPKSEYNQEETNEVWPQENNSSSWDTEGDEAWSNNQNWRHEKREIAKPNYSNSRQSANNSFVRRSYNSSFSDGKNDEEFQKFLNSRGNFTGKVREEIGDLFNAPDDYSLAHCVAEDFSMGAGIAKEFKARFKRLGTLLDQNAKTGGLAILEDKDRYIYYLVTKARSRGKPTLHTLWRSLLKLRDHMVENNVTKLAIPQIGCGLDQLDWPKVKQMLEYVFSKNEVDIVVYILEYNRIRSGSKRSRNNTSSKYTSSKSCYSPPVKKTKFDSFTNRNHSSRYTYDKFDSNARNNNRSSFSHSPNQYFIRDTQEAQKFNSGYNKYPNFDKNKTNKYESENFYRNSHESKKEVNFEKHKKTYSPTVKSGSAFEKLIKVQDRYEFTSNSNDHTLNKSYLQVFENHSKQNDKILSNDSDDELETRKCKKDKSSKKAEKNKEKKCKHSKHKNHKKHR